LDELIVCKGGQARPQRKQDEDGDVGMRETGVQPDTNKWRRNKDAFGAQQTYRSGGSAWVSVCFSFLFGEFERKFSLQIPHCY
jgi:hypothetical protein